MNTSQTHRATSVDFSGGQIVLRLEDGTVVRAPLAKFRRLAQAPLTALNGYVLLEAGQGIHWPSLDEDLSVEGLVRDFGTTPY